MMMRSVLSGLSAGRLCEYLLVPLAHLVPVLGPGLVAALAGAPVLQPEVIVLRVQASHNTLAKTP